MGEAIAGDALKHLRHELRTPINHVLGYTELLIEECQDSAEASYRAALEELNCGGRVLLDQIQRRLNDSVSSVTTEQMREFEAQIRPEAAKLLASSQALASHMRDAGQSDIAADVKKVCDAFGKLLAIAQEAAGVHAAAEQAAAPESPATVAASAGHEGSSRILIAEDVPANRDILRRRLEKEGYSVWEAENGVEALRMLNQAPYDLLILDLMMPEMDGFEVLQALKNNPRHSALPVIMISALDEIQSVVRCIEMGAEDYLPKPFNPVLLRARVGASLEKKRLQDAERRKTLDLQQTLERLKETQAQLVVQEKMASLGALTAGIAHEIKNPLNFVTNFAHLSIDLAQELTGLLAPVRANMPVADAEYLDSILADLSLNASKIQEHGKRADSIVRSMLAHSRGGPGQKEATDLNALVTEAVNLAYHGCRAKDANFNSAIEARYAADLPPAIVFAQDLSRVILNIANNAFYAVHQKQLAGGQGYRPTLAIGTELAGREFVITIRDNGTGMPQSVVDKIFTPFFTTKPTGSGTGLGLSLSYQIVAEQHQGSMQVNTAEGEYTEFIIRIPSAV